MTLNQPKGMEDARLVLPFPSIFYATIYLAESQGFFADLGLRGRISYVERGGDPVEGLSTGVGDVAVGGIVRLMRFPLREAKKFKVIGQINSASGFSILGHFSGPFEWADLSSRKFIPFSESRTPWLFTRSTLARHRIDPDRVELVSATTTDEAIKLFLSGAADFIELPEPQVSALLLAGHAQLCAAMARCLGNMPFSVLITRRDFLKTNSHILDRIVEAVRRTQKWIQKSSVDVVAKRLNLLFPSVSMPVMSMAVSNYKMDAVWAPDTTIMRHPFETMHEIIVNGGERLRSMDYGEMIDSRLSISSATAPT